MKCYVISILFCLLGLNACKPSSAQSSKDVTVEEAKALIENKKSMIILDVRTPEEWSAGVINGAVKFNIKDADFADKVARLDKRQPVLVYCKRGGRSAKATVVLEKAGFTEIYNMVDGYDGYIK